MTNDATLTKTYTVTYNYSGSNKYKFTISANGNFRVVVDTSCTMAGDLGFDKTTTDSTSHTGDRRTWGGLPWPLQSQITWRYTVQTDDALSAGSTWFVWIRECE